MKLKIIKTINLIFINSFFLFNFINVNPKETNLNQETNHFESLCLNFKKLKPIFFKVWTTTIKNEVDLNENAEIAIKILNEFPIFKILIIGQTSPFRLKYFTSEMLLSFKRAEAIKDFFIKKGIPENRIITTGIGSQNSMITDQENEAENEERKVELFFTIDN